MKRLFVLLLVIITLVLSMIVIAAPPVLDSHQFYGTVYWDETITEPVEVIAEIGSVQSTSEIKEVTCNKDLKFCQGRYGFGFDNILRISGKSGDSIDLFVDNTKLKTVKYSSDASVSLDFNTASVPLVKPKCKPDWAWGNYTTCKDNKQTRFGIDGNECNAKNTTQTRICGNFTKPITKVDCSQSWECGTWSACSASAQTRTCYRVDDCDAKLKDGKVASIISVAKPTQSKFCLAESKSSFGDTAPKKQDSFDYGSFDNAPSCTDGKKNQDEVKTDCGGVCDACQKNEKNNLILIIAGVVIVLALAGGAAWYFFVRRKQQDPEVSSDLSRAFSSGRARGMSNDQVSRKLQDRGWDSGIINRFLNK